MRTTIVIGLLVMLAGLDLAHGDVGAPASRLFCQKVARATDDQGARIKKSSFTVSLFVNALTCIVKTPPKTYCNFTTALAIDPPPTTVVPGATTTTNQFTCYAMKCPKDGGGSLGTRDDLTPGGQILTMKSPNLYCTPIAGE
jgi:hypothetical protein